VRGPFRNGTHRAARGGYRSSASVSREVDLMGRIAGGDRQAFELLYNVYHRRLARYLRRFNKRPDVVEGFVNDTLWIVWRKARDFRGDSRPSTWIFGTVS
jgi:DNA-directed RNA polymerase specialized sigma24 family protein